MTSQRVLSPRRSGEAPGSALVITLSFLVILTILAIGILETSRMDRTSSSLFSERATAAFLAQNPVDELVAKLQDNTADVNRYWISQPGQIVVGAQQDDASTTNGDSRKILTGAKTPDQNPGATDPRIIYLHSGVVTKTSYPGQDFLNPPNLNVATFQDPSSFLITDRKDSNGVTVQMQVRWNYVRKNGTVDTNEPPVLTNTANPITGRYAYWADDESAKVNYNLAWKRDASPTTLAGKLPVGHPSRISLLALDVFSSNNSLADTLHQFVTQDNYTTINQHLFNSPLDARQATADVANALKANKFEVTQYNHDPDTTYFNEQRIALTTQASRAGGRPYLQIMSDESKDPGYCASLDQTKLNTVMFGSGGTASNPKAPGLVYYLSRSDWPMVSGTSSFQQKYFNNDVTQLTQFAINIIDYVRTAESKLPIVEPIRGRISTSGSAVGQFLGEWLNANSAVRGVDGTFKGLTRGAMITKMALLITNNTDPTVKQGKMFVEIYLPKNYGVASVNLLTDYQYIFQVTSTAGTRLNDAPANTGTTIASTDIVSNSSPGGGSVLTAGNRAVISQKLTFSSMTAKPAAQSQVALRAALTRYAANPVDPTGVTYRQYPILEVAPIGDSQLGRTPRPSGALYTIPDYVAVSTAAPPARALLTDDPRVSGVAGDWKQSESVTWGTQNPIASPLTSASVPQQDTDSAGQISQASLYMPAFGVTSTNPTGIVSSIGELGYIHTGMQVTSTATAGVPWRTLRLQPSKLDATVVPDWAFMDLFTLPIPVPDSAKPVFAPHTTAIGGRINVNSNAKPENINAANIADRPFGGARILPLEAVLLGAHTDSTDSTKVLSISDAQTIAQNVYNRTLATNGKLYGYTDGFYSQGEVAEIKGVADSGESSEELVRQITNLTTTRGNVFSVYSVGQSLKQTPQGKLVVVAENRQQSMIERYLIVTNNADGTTTKQVKFRTVYFRPLTP